MISVTIDGANAAELHAELRALLAGDANRISPTAADVAKLEAPGGAQEKRPSGRTRAAAADKAAAAQAISTGEERVDPEADKHDAADEAAESAKTKPADLTHDDVKKLLGGYVQAYGMEAAQADGVDFIFAPKISEIPNTQAALAKAIIGIASAINSNPKKRELNGDGLSAEKLAELKPIVQAAQAVK